MSEKYTIVQHEKRLFWLRDCPVLLQSYALTKNNVDNSIFLQCKFENIADKSIKAMYIAVKCSDIAHKQVTDVDNFSYLDISIEPYSLFGDKTPVMLPDNTTRHVSIIPLKVIFSDDSTWENTSERAYKLAEYEQQPISSLGELADQYKRDLHNICADSDKHNYLPTNTNGFTICGCGQVIKSDVLTCPMCGVTIEKLFALNNSNTLREHLTQYQATQEQTQKNQKAKKRKFIRGITVAGIAVVLAVSISFTYSIIKQNTLIKAHNTAQLCSDRFSASEKFAAWIEGDGTIKFTEPYQDFKLDSDKWHDVKSISAYSSNGTHSFYIKGMRADGVTLTTDLETLSSTEYEAPKYDLDVTKDISIAQLLSDGTVVSDSVYLPTLTDIIDIEDTSQYQTVAALGKKGTVTTYRIGLDNRSNQNWNYDTANWRNIAQIAVNNANIVGLRTDGTVVVTGADNYGQYEAENWTNIAAIRAEENSIYGIKKDGTVVGVGYIPQHCNYDLNEVKLW